MVLSSKVSDVREQDLAPASAMSDPQSKVESCTLSSLLPHERPVFLEASRLPIDTSRLNKHQMLTNSHVDAPCILTTSNFSGGQLVFLCPREGMT